MQNRTIVKLHQGNSDSEWAFGIPAGKCACGGECHSEVQHANVHVQKQAALWLSAVAQCCGSVGTLPAIPVTTAPCARSGRGCRPQGQQPKVLEGGAVCMRGRKGVQVRPSQFSIRIFVLHGKLQRFGLVDVQLPSNVACLASRSFLTA